MSYPYVCIDKDGNRHYTDVRIVSKLPKVGMPFTFSFNSEARKVTDITPFNLPDQKFADVSDLDFYMVSYIPHNLVDESTKIIAIKKGGHSK